MRCSAAVKTASQRAIVPRLSRPGMSGSAPRLEGTKQPGHGAGEGVGKPGLGPPRAVPAPRDRRGSCNRACWVRVRPAGPADGALGKSVGALESPADADIGTGPFRAASCPPTRAATRSVIQRGQPGCPEGGGRKTARQPERPRPTERRGGTTWRTRLPPIRA